MYIIFHFETRYELGILYALIATFLSSLFSVLNKKISNDFHPQVTTFYEMLSGFLIISVYLFFNNGTQFFTVIPDAYDFLYLLILGVICTAFAFSAIIRIMQKLSAYQVVLAINLEPVYGIIAAWFIFGNSEQMTTPFYIGASIIILSVAIYTILSRRKSALKNNIQSQN
jgi:drug/metabolite transporter (DMT)-like permease